MRRKLAELIGLAPGRAEEARETFTETPGASEAKGDGAGEKKAETTAAKGNGQTQSATPVRSRAQSEYTHKRRLSKGQEEEVSGRGRARTLSAWTAGASNANWTLGRRSSVHAVDFGVLNSANLPDLDTAPEVCIDGKDIPIEPKVDEACCLICMGRATKKKPLVNIPCKNQCNLAPVHSKCIYEWKAQKKGSAPCPLCRGPLGEVDYTPPDLLRTSELHLNHIRKRFVLSAIPKAAGTVRCYLKVTIGFWGSPARYEMYLQQPDAALHQGGPLPDEKSPREGDVLLMVAKKSLNRWGCSRINISLDNSGDDYKKESFNYLGQVQADFAGLSHTLSVPYKSKIHGSNAGGHLEIGAIQFSQNRVGSASGPRRLQCVLPSLQEVDPLEMSCCSESTITSEPTFETHVKLAEKGEIEIEDDLSVDSEDDEPETKRYVTRHFRPSSRNDTLLALLRKNSANLADMNEEKFITGQNKEPYWLETIHAYSLDFGGRVTLPSNKNFQLELTNRVSDEIGLQFGKVATSQDRAVSVYTLDFSYPLSPIQAFGFALSSCDRKLACA